MTIKTPRVTDQEIREALRREGSVKDAAILLGISRQTFYEYLRHYEIPVERRTVAA